MLVNRLAQILTEEMDIPKTETIAKHFTAAHTRLLHSRNTNIVHLNIRKDTRFEKILIWTG